MKMNSNLSQESHVGLIESSFVHLPLNRRTLPEELNQIFKEATGVWCLSYGLSHHVKIWYNQGNWASHQPLWSSHEEQHGLWDPDSVPAQISLSCFQMDGFTIFSKWKRKHRQFDFKWDILTRASSSTEMTRFPSCSKYSNAALAICSHSSRASNWYGLIAAAQNSSKSIFLKYSWSIWMIKTTSRL